MQGQAAAQTERAGWYVVQSKPREEARALEHLRRQRYECFLPTLVQERVVRGGRVERREPMFPRYFFIHLNSVEDNWYPIRSTRGVSEIVRRNHKPVPVPDSIVEGIRERIAGGSVRKPLFVPGESVRITEPPFSQLEAIFVANDGDERVVLLLNILQNDQRLSFPISSVRKLA